MVEGSEDMLIRDKILATFDTLDEAKDEIERAERELARLGLDDVYRVYWLPMELGRRIPGYRVFLGRK